MHAPGIARRRGILALAIGSVAMVVSPQTVWAEETVGTLEVRRTHMLFGRFSHVEDVPENFCTSHMHMLVISSQRLIGLMHADWPHAY